MALGPVYPGLSMSLFSWLVVVRREKLFGLNIGKVRARAWRHEQFWARIEEGENGEMRGDLGWVKKCRRLGLDKEPGMGRDEAGRAGSKRAQI